MGRHRSRAGTKAAGKDTGLKAGIGTEGSTGARAKQNYVIGIEAEAETAANVIPTVFHYCYNRTPTGCPP